MNFRETTLGEISGGGSYGLGASSSSDSTGPKFLRTTDIISGTIDWSNVPYCSADSATIAKYKLFSEDIVISRTGANAGANCLVLEPPENAIFAGYLVRFQIDRELADARYVGYVLRSSAWKDYVEVTRTGSAQPQFNAVLMGQFPITLPSLNVQKAISNLLSGLDARIVANNVLSKTLEGIAQTIFKSWFIDFDPVKAKMVGEKPCGMDAATAALFPDSMEESELGLIPKGWKSETIKALCDSLVNGSTPLRTNSTFWDSEDIPWYKTGELSDGFLFDSKEAISKMALDKTSVKMLPKGSVLMAIYAAPTVGRLGILTKNSTFNQACTGMVAKDKFGTPFLYLTLFNRRVWFNSLAIGAAQQNISKVIVENCPALTASPDVQNAFLKIVQPIFDQLESIGNQSNSLISIRDSLLPRLISGELQIPEEMLAS